MRHRTTNALLTLQISSKNLSESSSDSLETSTENTFEKTNVLEKISFLETLLLDGHEVPSSCPIAFDFSTPQNLELLDILLSWQRIKLFMASERLAFVLESTRKERGRSSALTSVSPSQLAYEKSHISSHLLEVVSTDLRMKINRRKGTSSFFSQNIPLPPGSHPARLLNVLWRRWNQMACKSPVVSPISIGWMKEADTNPMYGPLYLHYLSNNIEYENCCFPNTSEYTIQQRRQSTDTDSSRNVSKYVYGKPLKSVLKSPCFGMDVLDVLVNSFSHERMSVVHPGSYPKIYLRPVISRKEVIDVLKNYPTYNIRLTSKCQCFLENYNVKKMDSNNKNLISTISGNDLSEMFSEFVI
ncbi:hypothetical protein HK096_002925 [Nowakowskiella sp. JEL0078]|nr:hypothetical protein HK096_002925 [Nowakowskiella sp. JEL0078]